MWKFWRLNLAYYLAVSIDAFMDEPDIAGPYCKIQSNVSVDGNKIFWYLRLFTVRIVCRVGPPNSYWGLKFSSAGLNYSTVIPSNLETSLELFRSIFCKLIVFVNEAIETGLDEFNRDLSLCSLAQSRSLKESKNHLGGPI